MLKAENISKSYFSGGRKGKEHSVLAQISLEIEKGRVLGIIGDSGSGKTTLGKIVAGIERPAQGRIVYNGEELSQLSRAQRAVFRRRVQMLFQDPEGALNPLKRVAKLLDEVCRLTGMTESTRKERIGEMIETVGLSGEVLDRYPSQLSGGQNQRVALARILLLEPQLIVLDEPTSSLDVSMQAQILKLLKYLQETRDLAYLFISHDRDVIDFMCDRVGVLREGRLRVSGTALQPSSVAP
jgi:peptide/nickel transport system ATP-binding protein